MFPFNAPAVRSLALGSIAVITASLLGACQQQPSDSSTTDTDGVREISRLKLRLDQLERRIDEAVPSSDDRGDRVPPGPVKSVTFRSGTALAAYEGCGRAHAAHPRAIGHPSRPGKSSRRGPTFAHWPTLLQCPHREPWDGGLQTGHPPACPETYPQHARKGCPGVGWPLASGQ